MLHLGLEFFKALIKGLAHLIVQVKTDTTGPDQAFSKTISAKEEGKVQKIPTDTPEIIGRR